MRMSPKNVRAGPLNSQQATVVAALSKCSGRLGEKRFPGVGVRMFEGCSLRLGVD